MTLILAESFDRYDIQSALSPWSGTCTDFSNTTGRDGVGQCLQMNDYFSSTSRYLSHALPATVTQYIGCSIKVDRQADYANCALLHVRGGGQSQLILSSDPAGTLSLSSSNLGISAASAAGVLTDLTWHSLEIYLYQQNSGGVIEVKLNGVVVMSYTGDTYYSSNAQAEKYLRLYAPRSSPSAIHYFDNLYVCNGEGTVHNGYLGDVRFSPLNALVDTATSDFTDVGAGASSAARINDALPVESTYLSSETVGHQDRFTVAPLGVGAASIVALLLTAHAKKDGGGERLIKTSLVSGATTEDSANIGLADGFNRYQQIIALDPDTAAAWTKAGADAVLVGVEVVS